MIIALSGENYWWHILARFRAKVIKNDFEPLLAPGIKLVTFSTRINYSFVNDRMNHLDLVSARHFTALAFLCFIYGFYSISAASFCFDFFAFTRTE